MIELGLARIGRLLQHTQTPWRAIHVAGTNGKGSITSYISALLHSGGIRCGRFNSPHLIDRWDCITINERAVSESLFRHIEDRVKLRNEQHGINASEFELLTATAFEIFSHERVEVGVVEVGLGGRLDATNILNNVLVSVIAKIGLDHQSLLGNTLEAIAAEKAGILRANIPCIIDGTNSPEVLAVLNQKATEVGTKLIPITPTTNPPNIPELTPIIAPLDLEQHQLSNLLIALEALNHASPFLPRFNLRTTLHTIPSITWPGRLHHLPLHPLIPRTEPVLLDGAHNAQSATALSTHVARRLRTQNHNPTANAPVTWLLAMSAGKDTHDLLRCILRPGDNVVTVEFGAVDGMPWVKPVNAEELLAAAEEVVGVEALGHSHAAGHDIVGALMWADRTAGMGAPLVVAGSLYLVSDVLTLLRVSRGHSGGGGGEEEAGVEKAD